MDAYGQMFAQFTQQYWGIISLILGAIVYLLSAKGKASSIIKTHMLGVEKNAEQLALTTGDQKFNYVASEGYAILPAWAKLAISQTTFVAIVVRS